ncbi:NAD(P)H-dependent flavin oxidoreductase [Chelatococcus reniformis]|uniref:Monooxygenase n=1 Tax=Chelatococcus reniformis TaxID=1494448 RepID=A0A916XB53_9HYPH|nr:nitronate monooxygenase [Chelatococcus reniformis]GGC58841.1 monooxygenase [Chelatococcus reniformis]
MRTPVCDLLGVDFPLFAFSHCRDVVVAVSKAGGFGVLGAVGYSPDELEAELRWIDDRVGGRPYGIDLAIPENMSVKYEQGLTSSSLKQRIPPQHHAFVDALLRRHGIDPYSAAPSDEDRAVGLMHDTAERCMDVAFRHPIRFIVQALGLPPQSMIDRGRAAGVPVGALVGSAEHAIRQVEMGVDVIVAQGTEAGGHCGEVSTMVLVPEVIRAVAGVGAKHTPVLAAGGIVSGRQMAAAMTMGADGAWTGSVWLPTVESEISQVMREKFLAARSRDTVRSRASSGKLARQLRSAWTEAWEQPDSPGYLQMPFQPMLTAAVMQRATKAAEAGSESARQLVNYYVGQGVGLLDDIKSARTVVQEFMEDYAAALERVQTLSA